MTAAVTQPAYAVLKAFEILALFRDAIYLTPSDCALRLGMPRTTAHRMLVTLRHAEMLDVTSDGRYSMSMSMFELGSWTPLARKLNEVATSHLLLLRDMTGLVVHLAVRDRSSLVYLQKAHRGRASIPTNVGARGPLHATGVGKALLAAMPDDEARALFEETPQSFTQHTHRTWESLAADLDTIRSTGYSFDLEERALGVCCLATSVRDGEGKALAAISIVAPADRYRDKLKDFRVPLSRTAVEIARDLTRRRMSVAS